MSTDVGHRRSSLRLKAGSNHAGLVHVCTLYLLFFVGILEVGLSDALPMAASRAALSCAEADHVKTMTESAAGRARRYLDVMFISSMRLVEAFAI
jgi:hypothetical protein